MAAKIYPLIMQAGIQRDGTNLSSNYCIDGDWCRFYKSLPKKMGGYVQIIGGLPNIVRGMEMINDSPNFRLYYGDQNSLHYVLMNSAGLQLGIPADRTPLLFAANPDNDWQFGLMFSSTDNGQILIAYAAPNLANIDNTFSRPIYFGDPLANGPLVPTGQECSGGIVVLHPFLFSFGNDGQVSWSNANDPTTIMDTARVTGSKIIYGLPTRGGNSSPAGLLWSLDSLIRVTQVGTSAIEFAFDTVTSESSILSRHGVIQYDSQYYWAGTDRFLMYNGVVQELPNSLSLRFFFENLNYAQRQKVVATKITSYGEIWWFFPTGNNVEANHAVIYNIRDQTWYDTAINRSEAEFDQTFTFPVWADNDVPGNYSIWMHENGVNKVEGNAITSILSSFTTPIMAWPATGPDHQRQNLDRIVDLERIEPDFSQTGEMLVRVSSRAYANSPEVAGGTYPFDDTTTKVDMREQGREMFLTFVSNQVDGDYYMGQTLMVAKVGDERP